MSPSPSSPGQPRPALATVAAIAVLAYAADDAVHEALGHGSAALFGHIQMLSISTVGLQTAESSRMVAAAGSIANIVVGALALWCAGRSQGFNLWRYFLWLFGFLNLMNGTGYLLASALLSSGDWAVVIAGLEPAWLWRTLMALIGAATYWLSVRWASRVMNKIVLQTGMTRDDVVRLTVSAYVTGGILFTTASLFNPVGPALILVSGMGASFGLTFGLLLVPRLVQNRLSETRSSVHLPAFSWTLTTLALLVAIVFIAVFGRGVRLS